MSTNLCPKTARCPLFQGEMLSSSKAQEIYMRIYCKAGIKGRERCKRFILSKIALVPSDLMPNDKRSVEELKSVYSMH